MDKVTRNVLQRLKEQARPYGLEVTLDNGRVHPTFELRGRGHRFNITIGRSTHEERDQINFTRQRFTRRVKELGLQPLKAAVNLAAPSPRQEESRRPDAYDRLAARARLSADIVLAPDEAASTPSRGPEQAVGAAPTSLIAERLQEAAASASPPSTIPLPLEEPPMADAPKIERNVLSLKERIHIHDLLKGSLNLIGEGWVEYNNDWSDVQIAKVAATDLGRVVTPANVAGVRKEMFGELRPAKTDANAEFAERIALLERAFLLLAEANGWREPNMTIEQIVNALEGR